MRRPSRSDLGDETGFTLVELMVGVGLLAIAVVAMLGTLNRTTETARYTELRNQSLDQLRIMSATFGKDVRQAVRATAIDDNLLTIDTYVNGGLHSVTWRVEPTADGSDRFERVAAGLDPVEYIVDLTSPAVFSYEGKTDPLQVNRVRLTLATRPDPRHPAVSVETDLEMRNVP